MVSVIILNNGEPNVVQLTFENLYKELKDIHGAELLIRSKWFDLEGVKNRYVCFVEADCLIEPRYFHKQLERFKQKGYSRVTGIMSSVTSVNYWDNTFYGYHLDTSSNCVMPSRSPKSSGSFMVQIAYIPGSILRVSMLEEVLKGRKIAIDDLTQLSTELSLGFWKKGYRVYLNPKTSYLSTESYINDLGKFGASTTSDVMNLFARESI